MNASGARRWGAIGLALSAACFVAAAAPGCGPGDEAETPETTAPRVEPAPEFDLPFEIRVSGAGTEVTRRILEGCNPAEESKKYEDLVETRARAKLLWDHASEDVAHLLVPVYVTGIEDDRVAVRFLRFPLRDEYIHMWLRSGHVEATGTDVFRIDPCSATLEAWPRAGSG